MTGLAEPEVTQPLGGVAHPGMNTRYTEPLTDEFPSVFLRFREVFRIVWRSARGYTLDLWQEDLLARITEINPATGHLRHRQVLVSLPRQQGKSEIGAALALLFLLWKIAPYVIGIASSVEQARLVYDRTMTLIRGSALARRYDRLADTRGIRSTSGGRFEIKASKSAALQGLPIDLGLVDEVHLLISSLWSDLVSGTGGRPDCMVVGITTAGDEDSELLHHLYALADQGLIGHFIFESPDDEVPADDEGLGQRLLASNPALASGRLDLATVVADVRTLPEADILRYRLNRMVQGSDKSVFTLRQWAACAGRLTKPHDVIFAIDRTPDWSAATISAHWRSDGVQYAQVAASLVRPTQDRLLALCVDLQARHEPAGFALDGYSLGALAKALKARGMTVYKASGGEVVAACSLLYAKVVQKTLVHASDPLLTVQIPATRRKNAGEGWRIVRAPGTQIDGVMATTLGVYFTEVREDPGIQLF